MEHQSQSAVNGGMRCVLNILEKRGVSTGLVVIVAMVMGVVGVMGLRLVCW